MQHSAAAVSEAIMASDEPSLEEGLSSPERSQRIEAVREKLVTLQENGTWILDKPPPVAKALLSEIILKLKGDASGNAARFKAKLSAK